MYLLPGSMYFQKYKSAISFSITFTLSFEPGNVILKVHCTFALICVSLEYRDLLSTRNDINCAALELCVCKDLPATPTHWCPACQECAHAFCGETCEEASIQYQTTCFKCFARYSATFEDPEDFDAWKIQHPEELVFEAADDDVHLLQSSINH